MTNNTKKKESKWKQWNKSEKLGVIIHISLLILFILGLIYLFYISGIYDEIYDKLFELGGIYKFIYIFAALGILPISTLYFRISERLFYPETKEERELRLLRKEIRRNFRKGIISKKEKRNKYKEIKIRELENKIKEIKEEIK